MKEIIRVYELKEDCLLHEGLLNANELDTKTVNISTGRTFSMQDMETNLLIPSLYWKQNSDSPKVIDADMDVDGKDDTCYYFEFNKDCNIKSDAQSVVTKALIIKIPSNVNEHMLGEQMEADPMNAKRKTDYEDFIKILETVRSKGQLHANIVKRNVFIQMQQKKFYLEKKKQIVNKTVKIALGLATAGLVVYGISKIPNFINYLENSQKDQRRQEQQNLMQYNEPTISELQQQRILLEQNPELQEYLNGILDQHQESNKTL